MSPNPSPPTTLPGSTDPTQRQSPADRRPTYPNAATPAFSDRPSSKHTLAASPPGKLRSARPRAESVR